MFERSGDRSRRIIVLEMLVSLEPGNVIKYDEFIEALSLDPHDPRWLKVVQSACNRAIAELEREHKKTIESVKGVGYRMAFPRDHVRLAEVKQTRGSRAIGRALRTAKHVDHNQLSAEESRKADDAVRMLSAQRRAIANNNLTKLRQEAATAALFPKRIEQ